MSNELSMRVSMDTVRPISPPRDTDGQIKSVTKEERDVSADVRNDITVSGNDVPAESRVIQEVTESNLNRAIDELSHRAQNISRDLEFSVDEGSDKTVVTVYDSETEEVIRQIPSEEMLALAQNVSGEATLINVQA